MRNDKPILVLGAYGLAGRAIVARLIEKTPYPVIAAGRSQEKLQALSSHLVTTHVLNVSGAAALVDACNGASFVINAAGPFALHGAAVARTVLESGRPYLDCANEQRHYHNLRPLDGLARDQGLPLVTAAGVFPGCSTLLAAHLLKRVSGNTAVDCCCVQFRHAYPDSGLASMMGAILEAAEQPVSVCGGELVPARLGRSIQWFDLPAPFGRRRLLELPLIDAFTVRNRFSPREYHTWFYAGDMPSWLLGFVRALQPQRRPRVYRMIERIMRGINNHETAKAIAAGLGPECLIHVTASAGEFVRRASVTFRDGAVATACLPVYIADAYLQGKLDQTGLRTPLDLLDPGRLVEMVDGATLHMDLG